MTRLGSSLPVGAANRNESRPQTVYRFVFFCPAADAAPPQVPASMARWSASSLWKKLAWAMDLGVGGARRRRCLLRASEKMVRARRMAKSRPKAMAMMPPTPMAAAPPPLDGLSLVWVELSSGSMGVVVDVVCGDGGSALLGVDARWRSGAILGVGCLVGVMEMYRARYSPCLYCECKVVLLLMCDGSSYIGKSKGLWRSPACSVSEEAKNKAINWKKSW